MMPIKILIPAQMKMKLEQQQTYNSLMIKNLIPKWIKMNLELINPTCKYQLKLKLKLKLNLILNLIQKPIQNLNPTLIPNQMIAPKKMKIFNLTLPQSQPTLVDGPDGTGTLERSQTDSLKTLMISSSDP